MLIDTHCHLHDREFFTEKQAEEMLTRAADAGVEQILCIATSVKGSKATVDFAKNHPGVFATIGIHPESAKEGNSLFAGDSVGICALSVFAHTLQSGGGETLFSWDSAIRDDGCGKDGRFPCDDRENPFRAHENKVSSTVVAIGEIGLDYHYSPETRLAQIKLFEQMLQLAADYNLPTSFHVREAFDDFFAVVANFPKITGVVHSFSDNKRNLRKILETTDFYVGVNGMATYSTLPTPPLERILLETDAPFLTPTPNRGKINEPAYIPDIAKFLSVKLGVDEQKIAEITTENARKLFHLPDTFLRAAKSD